MSIFFFEKNLISRFFANLHGELEFHEFFLLSICVKSDFTNFFLLPDQNGTVETQEPLYNGSRQSSSRYSDNHPLIGSSNEGSTSVLVNPFADVQLLPVTSQQPSSSVTSSPLHNLNLKPEHRFSSLRGFSQQLMSSQNHYSPASKLFTNRYVRFISSNTQSAIKFN